MISGLAASPTEGAPGADVAEMVEIPRQPNKAS
jgi:hypothetical protein